MDDEDDHPAPRARGNDVVDAEVAIAIAVGAVLAPITVISAIPGI